MNGFYISIKNDLLEKKHMDAMGSSVWLYMWLIDKVTSIDEEGMGKVLGGKPIKHDDFDDNLALEVHTYRRYVSKLERGGYIRTTRTPYGLVFHVMKAKKIFGEAKKPVDNYKKRYDKNGTSRDKNGTSRDKNGTSNKTRQLDKTIRQKENKNILSSKTQNLDDFYDKFEAKRYK